MDVFLYKFLKFGVVGFSGMLIDFGFTYLCKEKLKIQKFIANAIGFIAAASFNYYLNRIWTFNSNNTEIAKEYAMFIFVSIIGLGINTAVLWFVTKYFRLNFYFAKLIAIGVTTIWNFLANYYITFSL